MIGLSSVGSQAGPINPVVAAKQLKKRLEYNKTSAFLCYMKGRDEDHVIVITTKANTKIIEIHDVNGDDWIQESGFPTRILATHLTKLGVRWVNINNSNRIQSITASNKCWSYSYNLYRKLTTHRHN